MGKRLQKLTETAQFKACLYIDPRFNYIGSNRMSSADKELAQNYLLELWERLNELDGIGVKETSYQSNHDESNDFVEQYLNKYFERDTPGSSGQALPADDKILQQIKELELRPKVRMHSLPTEDRFDIVQYWNTMRTSHHDVHRLAVAILSAPSTQVTVERAFSGLKLVLTDQRQNLSDHRIQDLMILKLNHDLLPVIAEKLCADMC
ncbi:uncharacterized protein LOC134205669 [Armigeres subalbatus]|uniref:uncharacterized protein LOC134205669 n=1 Tax=Armigeres subalbatus TaxID=124917 RepID=UPI002ED573C9